MKRARFTQEQIIGILSENEAGERAGELARKTRPRPSPSVAGTLSDLQNLKALLQYAAQSNGVLDWTEMASMTGFSSLCALRAVADKLPTR